MRMLSPGYNTGTTPLDSIMLSQDSCMKMRDVLLTEFNSVKNTLIPKDLTHVRKLHGLRKKQALVAVFINEPTGYKPNFIEMDNQGWYENFPRKEINTTVKLIF